MNRSINLQNLASIAEITGAAAILVTLIYLAIQTNQNTEAIQANTRQAMIAADQALLNQVIEFPEIDEYYYKTDLSDREMRRLSVFLLQLVRLRETYWLQYQTGAIDDKTWKSYRESLIYTFSTPRTRQWWNNAVSETTMFDSGFVKEMERRLAETPILDSQFHIEAFRDTQ